MRLKSVRRALAAGVVGMTAARWEAREVDVDETRAKLRVLFL